MDLENYDNADLTDFFTKRFPSVSDRASIAREARVTFREPSSADPSTAWGGLLTRAREQSALPRLAHCAASRRPSDENLQGVAAILSGRQWPPVPRARTPMVWKQIGALCALVGIAGVAWAARGPRTVDASAEPVVAVASTPSEAMPSAAPEAPASTAAPSAEDTPADAKPSTSTGTHTPPGATPAPAAPAAVPANAATEDEAPEPKTGRASPAATPAPTASSMPDAPYTGNCRGPEGKLVGYWYAGRESPGQKGDQITVPRDLNVRADYPDKHNDYNRRAPIRCTLGVGKPLVLTADPIAVPGDAYWVPLHGTGR